MSTLKVNNLQVGQDSTATNNLTWFQPGSPDGTIRLGSGNAGSATSKFTFDKDGNLTCVGNINAASILAPIEGTLDDWIIHAGDTNTKFGFPANDTVSIETAGQQNVQVNGTRTLLTSPSGTNTTLRLQHQGNSGYGDIILDRQVNAFIIDNDPSNASNNQSYFSVKNKGTTNLHIKYDGKIGINTSSPARLIHAYESTNNNLLFLESGDTNVDIIQADTGGSTRIRNSQGSLVFYVNGDANSSSAANAVTGLTIDGDKDVHVYDDLFIPDKIIHEGDTNTAIRFPSADTITAETGGSERLRIDSSGNVGIGSAIPGKKLDVNGAIRSVGNNYTTMAATFEGRFDATHLLSLTVNHNSSTAQEVLGTWADSGGSNPRTVINASNGWKLGVGITDPDELLHIASTGTAKFKLTDKRTSIADGSQYGVIQFEQKDSNTPGVSLEMAALMTDTTNGATALQIKTGTPSTITERFRISSSGKVTVTSNSEPQVDVQATSAAGGSMRVQSAGAYAYYMAVSTNIHWRWGMPTGTSDWVLRESTNNRNRFWVDTGNGAYFQGTSHTNLEIRSNSASTKALIQTVQDSDVRIGASTNHPLALYAGTVERVRIGSSGEVILKRGGISATPSLEIYGSAQASDADADNLRFHNWGNSSGDYWDVGVNHGLDANGNNTKPSNTLKGAAIRFSGKNGAVTLVTSPSSTSTQYEGLTQNEVGHILTPQQPCFHVSLEGHKSATQDPLVFTDVRVNTGSHYSSSTGKFTAPVAGRYFFFFMGIKNSNSGVVSRVYVRKNNSNIYDAFHCRMQEEGHYANGSIQWIVTLAANDTIHLRLDQGGLHAAEYTQFGGYLIG